MTLKINIATETFLATAVFFVLSVYRTFLIKANSIAPDVPCTFLSPDVFPAYADKRHMQLLCQMTTS